MIEIICPLFKADEPCYHEGNDEKGYCSDVDDYTADIEGCLYRGEKYEG